MDVPHVARWLSVRIALLLLLSAVVGCTTASGAGDGLVPWNASSPLTWELFRAPCPADAVHRNEAAAIHMTVQWHATYAVDNSQGSWTGHVREVTVTNAMDPARSWVVPGGADELVLRHEQAHFDLNEVYRRKLAAVLPTLQADGVARDDAVDALHASLHRTAGELLSDLQAAQARYDAETAHGNNASAQARWEAQIDAWLRAPNHAP